MSSITGLPFELQMRALPVKPFFAVLIATAMEALPVLPLSSRAAANSQPMEMIEWFADLKSVADPAVPHTAASGKAVVAFDFDHQTLSINVQTRGISHVRSIELRSTRGLAPGDLTGAEMLPIYDSHHGSFSGSLVRIAKGPDFEPLAQLITNGWAVVVVRTAAHPNGDIAGSISMHKSPMQMPNH